MALWPTVLSDHCPSEESRQHTFSLFVLFVLINSGQAAPLIKAGYKGSHLPFRCQVSTLVGNEITKRGKQIVP